MNRPMKFRVWHKRRQQMFREDIAVYSTAGFHSPTHHYRAGTYISFGWDWQGKMLEVPEEAILMQFTGLLDKHGKEIYEGDIVRWTDYRGYDPGNVKTNVVVFEEGCFVVGEGTEDFIDGQQSEILGNLYEHPELREKHTPVGSI